MKPGHTEDWTANKNQLRHFQAARPGDIVFGYLAGPTGRCVYTVAEVSEALDQDPEKPAITIRAIDGIRALPHPITLDELRKDPILARCTAVSCGMRGTMFSLDPQAVDRLVSLIKTSNPSEGALLEARMRREDALETVVTVEQVTFHPSYAYEDFIEGIRPVLSHDGESEQQGFTRYELVPGVFRSLCLRADKHRERPFYLLIDEINRANIPAVFGELITLLEKDKRAWLDTSRPDSIRFPAPRRGLRVKLPYSKDEFTVPPNVFILGTMNTADRSIALMDLALRRRFRFEAVDPDPALVAAASGPEDADGQPGPAIQPWLLFASTVLAKLNARVVRYRGIDYRLGHAYFLPLRRAPDAQAFRGHFHTIWHHEVLPLLSEYFHDDPGQLEKVVGAASLRREGDERIWAGFKDLDIEQTVQTLSKELDVALPSP